MKLEFEAVSDRIHFSLEDLKCDEDYEDVHGLVICIRKAYELPNEFTLEGFKELVVLARKEKYQSMSLHAGCGDGVIIEMLDQIVEEGGKDCSPKVTEKAPKQKPKTSKLSHEKTDPKAKKPSARKPKEVSANA